ncbi:MAG TPA: hypothetical protein VMI54_08405, partial [Polyangiaceae bacterium]|nr:hypothetical protein [Polyangiaceae bacterium]
GGDATGGTTATGGSSGTSAAGGTDASGGSGATAGTDAAGGSGATAGTDAAGGSMSVGGSGGTGMTTGGGAGMPSGGAGGSQSGAGGSAGMSNCDALETDYSNTLEQAEACNPNSGKDQCTQMEKSDLVCGGCSVYVNPDNTDAVAHLDELRQEVGTNCVHPCPAIACVVPSATCMPVSGSKNTGRCSSALATTQ